jgi:hypothetical protein
MLGMLYHIMLRAIDLTVDERVSVTSNRSGTNLVVVRNQLERANEDYMSKLNLRQTMRRRVFIDQDSFDSGSEYGAGVALGKRSKRLPQFA